MVVYSGDSGQTQKQFSDDKPYETEEAERLREIVWEMRGVQRDLLIVLCFDFCYFL
jgi:hypothetical protein